MTNPAPTPTPTALTRGPASNKQVGGERHKLLLAAILTPRRRVRVVWMLRCVFKSTELVHSQRGAKKKINKKEYSTALHSTPHSKAQVGLINTGHSANRQHAFSESLSQSDHSEESHRPRAHQH